MNICLIGDGLTNLVLAKTLIEKNIKVSLYYNHPKRKLYNTRTLGISKNNYDFIQNKIIKAEKLFWPINLIKIFTEKSQSNKILSFGENKQKLFYIIENRKLYKKIETTIKKNKNFKKIKIKNQLFYQKILNSNKFDIVINSEKNNLITNKIFYKKISKDYNSVAVTGVINHKKCKNNQAIQIFTNIGPLAFLPISSTKTSIVYSIYNYNFLTEKKIKDLILKYNNTYKIKYFSKFEKFRLKFSLNRNYFYKNILCFGDNLHSIHPLAGQGFNMILRDIKILLEIIDNKINLGLPLDISVLHDFEYKTKHLNYIFSTGVDFIYEFFKYDTKKNYSKKILKNFENNSFFKRYVSQFADKGLNIY